MTFGWRTVTGRRQRGHHDVLPPPSSLLPAAPDLDASGRGNTRVIMVEVVAMSSTGADILTT